MEPTTQQPTLVLGGTGKTGRRVVQRLQAAGRPVRVGTPSATPPFDWDDQSTWAPALEGVGSVYVTYYPDVAIPGAAAAIGAFAELAVATGVRRLVLLSGRGEQGARRSEQALQQSGADWTIVRSAFMAQNFNESFFLEPVRAGEVAFLADPDLAEPFIDADDIADVAVAALTGDGHVGQLYEVTGPRLLGWAQAVAEIAAAAGRPGTSPTSCGTPPPPASGAARPPPNRQDDGRAAGRTDRCDRPRLWAECGGVLRLLQLRDEGPRPPPASPGYRRHAVDQPDGGHPGVHGGTLWHRHSLRRGRHMGAGRLGRRGRPLPAGWGRLL